MFPLRHVLASRRSRPKTLLALTFAVLAMPFGSIGAAAAPDPANDSGTAACAHVSDSAGQCKAARDSSLQISLPSGAEQCPDSGTAAACTLTSGSSRDVIPGTASTPDGQSPCPAAPGVKVGTAAACVDAVPPASSADTGASSLVAGAPRLSLTVNTVSARPGQKVVLSATAAETVTGTGNAVEIFDQTAGTLAGACTQGSQCSVSYAASLGTHRFVAYITAPTPTMPARGTASNGVAVSWNGLTLEANVPTVGPGKPITLTASSTMASGSGYSIQIYDAATKARLTYCTRGNTCSLSITQPASGTRSIVAALAKPSPALPATDAQAQSEPLTLTWLAVNIASGSTFQMGGVAHLTASANADLTNTPWSLGILDDKGHLVGQTCKRGNTCTAQVAIDGSTPSFSAAIGAEPKANEQGALGQLLKKFVGPAELVDVQARSSAVKPSRLLWGVDSCKSFTGDPSGELYPKISGILGAPDFWGRYLTDAVCPPLSSSEVSMAHAKHMGILPIYNERDCSNVSGYETGKAYAAEAVNSARAVGLPQGRGIAIDIEPSGAACPGAANLDTGLIHGWYDGITSAGYAPIYYGNGTQGSEFATQWCYTVSALPYIGEHSYLWSFQPSLLGGYMKSNAPGFSPNLTGCLGFVHAWQYQIGSSSWAAPDVDGDEATSELPLWFP